MRNLFVKTALVLCTTIIFLPATVFATEPQNTEITSAEEGFTDQIRPYLMRMTTR